jgi:hypothetical protein
MYCLAVFRCTVGSISDMFDIYRLAVFRCIVGSSVIDVKYIASLYFRLTYVVNIAHAHTLFSNAVVKPYVQCVSVSSLYMRMRCAVNLQLSKKCNKSWLK